jgi:hypothetical protein
MKKQSTTHFTNRPDSASDNDAHGNDAPGNFRRRFDAVSLAFGLFFVLGGISFLLDSSDSFAERLGRLLPIVLIVLGGAMLLGRKHDDG